MNIPATIKLLQAQSNFAIANTPSFLIESLRNDTAIHLLSSTYNDDLLLADLKESVSKEPTDLREAVLPFAILVALSLKPSSSALRRAMDITPAQYDSWFHFEQVKNILLAKYPASSTTVERTLANVGVPTVASSTEAVRGTKIIIPN